LLIEVDGAERACEVALERIRATCAARGAKDSSVARAATERDRLWEIRSNMSGTLRRLARYKLSEDIAVPRRCLVQLLEQLDELSQRLRVRSAAYGHAGDGNLHVNFLWDEPEEAPRVQQAIRELFERTISLGGTLSGEHGIGLLKAPYLSLEQAPEMLELERSIKRSFDPENLLNPGKIFARK
jgi:glycolate oxidase